MKNNKLKDLMVFAEPTRLNILLMIRAAGELRGKDILEKLTITQPTLSHHMNLLTKAGILNSRKEGRCIWYSIVPRKVEEIAGTVKSFTSVGDELIVVEEPKAKVEKLSKTKPPKEEKHKKKDKKDKKKKKK